MNKTLLDPTWTDPRMLEPEYGVGQITLNIYFNSVWLPEMDTYVVRTLAFSWGVTVNGIEAFIENPKIRNASDQDYDIKEAIEKELGFRIDHLNYI